MLLCSGLWTNWATAKPSSGVLPYCPLLMKIICAPSQVMREGSDLNQQGHAGRQEQASSSSPAIFQRVFGSVFSAALAGSKATTTLPQRDSAKVRDLRDVIGFMVLVPLFNLEWP